jgi:hypothetical protein
VTSPYLLRPLRTIEQAMRDIERNRLSDQDRTSQVSDADRGAPADEATGEPMASCRSDSQGSTRP